MADYYISSYLVKGFIEMYGRAKLYQKAGYVLESLKDEWRISDEFFFELEQRSSQNKYYLENNTVARNHYVYHPRWHLYAPENLREIANKGINLEANY